MADNRYYECTVAGEYFKSTPGGKVLAKYELNFNVPFLGDGKTDTHYMSVIKNKLLTPQLKAKYQGAITYRTYEMVDRKLKGAAQKTDAPKVKSIGEMNKTELTAYIQAHCPEIDFTEVHTTVDKMRKAIRAYEEDKEAFLDEQETIKEDMRLDKTLANLNPIGPGNADADADPNNADNPDAVPVPDGDAPADL